MWRYPLMYERMVEAWLVHKIIWFPEIPLGELGCEDCCLEIFWWGLCSQVQFWQQLLHRNKGVLIPWFIKWEIFTQVCWEKTAPLVKSSIFLWLLPTVCIGILKMYLLEKACFLFFEEKRYIYICHSPCLISVHNFRWIKRFLSCCVSRVLVL